MFVAESTGGAPLACFACGARIPCGCKIYTIVVDFVIVDTNLCASFRVANGGVCNSALARATRTSGVLQPKSVELDAEGPVDGVVLVRFFGALIESNLKTFPLRTEMRLWRLHQLLAWQLSKS